MSPGSLAADGPQETAEHTHAQRTTEAIPATGNNSVIAPDGTTVVPGFSAARGFDVASGWGTINAARFVPSLAAATAANNQDQAMRGQARAELAGLRHAAGLSVSHIRPGGTAYLLAPNFLPGHPVNFAIDGRTVATLTANALGDVTYMIDPSLLKLPPGRHTLTLTGMLLSETAHFTNT